jgi:hypothetical protein
MGAGAYKDSTITVGEGMLYDLDRISFSIKGNFQKQNQE